MDRHKRTGRTRYRILSRKFRRDLLVLQVEFEGFVVANCGADVDVTNKRYWVDAKVEWITERDMVGDE